MSPGFFTRIALRLWLSLPTYVRLFTYKTLVNAGIRLYGRTISPRTYRLPFNLYAKFGNYVVDSEANAIRYVCENTTVPVPRIIDCISVPTGVLIVMTRLPGEPLGRHFIHMTTKERAQFQRDLGSALKQLHRTSAPDPLISAIDGKPFADWRISEGGLHGPFDSEKELYEYLYKRIPSEHHQRLRDLARSVHDVPHRLCLTHNDISPNSILVDNNRFSGLVGWEGAAWLPEWWEYTRSIYMRDRWREWVDLMNEAHPELYPKELEVETKFWDVNFPW